MKILKSVFFIIFSIKIIFIYGSISCADTVEMKNREIVKGVVVEEYKDRIVLSTREGEKQIMKENIGRLTYDREEQNFVSLAEFYQDKEKYRKAYYYYNKALEVNPDYKRAREGLNYVGIHVVNSDRRQKLRRIEILNEEERERRGISVSSVKNKEEEVKKSLGIVLKKVQHRTEISGIMPDSPAAKADIKKGDILLAMWGRAAKYMEPEEIMNKLLSPVIDVQITVERDYELDLKKAVPEKYGNLAGIRLGYSEMEGMIVKDVYKGSAAELAGIKKGDIILAVQGEGVRYMDIKEAAQIIDSRKGNILSLKVKRDTVIWKNFEA